MTSALCRRSRAAAFLAALALLLTATPLAAQSSSDVAARVDELLGGIESSPSPAQWQALGADGAHVLLEVAADASQLATTRARAVAALRHFPDVPEAADGVRALLEREAPAIVHRKALATLAELDPPATLELAPRWLEDADVSTREAAVRALQHVGGEGAAAALRARYPLESSQVVRDQIERAVDVGTLQPGPKE